MSDDNTARMLRSVSYYRIQADAERMRHPFTQDPAHLTVMTISSGEPRAAEAMIMDWFEQHLTEMEDRLPDYTEDDARSLWATYQHFLAQPSSMANLQRSELGIRSEGTPPDYGMAGPKTWKDWSTPKNIADLFDVTRGKELSMVSDTGGGKTNIKVLCGESWTDASPHHYVLHNVKDLKPARHEDRWHNMRSLRRMLQHIARTLIEDPDAKFLILFDEPGINLRSQAGKSVAQTHWGTFRIFKRKLHCTIFYGWQEADMVWSSLRKSPDVVHAEKEVKKEMRITFPSRKGDRVVDIVEIPKADSEYDDEGATHLDMDVDMQAVTRILSQEGKPKREVYRELLEALEGDALLLKDFKGEEASKDDVMATARELVLEDPGRYTNGKAVFLRDTLFSLLNERVGLTHTLAGALKADLDRSVREVRAMRQAKKPPSDVVRKLKVSKEFVAWVDSET